MRWAAFANVSAMLILLSIRMSSGLVVIIMGCFYFAVLVISYLERVTRRKPKIPIQTDFVITDAADPPYVVHIS